MIRRRGHNPIRRVRLQQLPEGLHGPGGIAVNAALAGAGQLLHGGHLLEAALADNPHPIAHQLHLLQDMAGHQHRDPL